MSYKQDQREWYLRAYDHKCAFPVGLDPAGWSWARCGRPQPLEAHHILPTAWIREQLPYQDPNEINFALGLAGIIICRQHHHIIHPDIGRAFSNYGNDKGGIARAAEDHREMARRGEVFWNDEYDQLLLQVAAQAILGYAALHKEDKYPKDTSWYKRPHPKKPDWRDQI